MDKHKKIGVKLKPTEPKAEDHQATDHNTEEKFRTTRGSAGGGGVRAPGRV